MGSATLRRVKEARIDSDTRTDVAVVRLTDAGRITVELDKPEISPAVARLLAAALLEIVETKS